MKTFAVGRASGWEKMHWPLAQHAQSNTKLQKTARVTTDKLGSDTV